MCQDTYKSPVVVIGIGNILLSDEGVGVRVIEHMRKLRLPDTVELIDAGTAGVDLLDVLADRQKVIVIDAAQADCDPGTVIRLTADNICMSDETNMSLHEFGIGQSLAMTRLLGCAPKNVVIFGIKPKNLEPGLELSEDIAAVVPVVVKLVMKELSKSSDIKLLQQ
jgi:hydrogenase maturation protease